MTAVPHFIRGLTAAMLFAAALAIVPAIGAQAADAPSSWWYDGFGVAEVQAAGWTGEGVKIAVIDQQINPDLPVFQGTNLTVDDDPLCKGGSVTTNAVKAPTPSNSVVHGSDVTALLIGNGKGDAKIRGIAPGSDVTFYGYGMSVHDALDATCGSSIEDTTALGEGINRAVDGGAQVISISLVVSTMTTGDAEAVARAIARGVVIVAGTPNTMKNTDTQWPWMYNGVVSVNAFGKDGYLQDDAEVKGQKNVWPEVTVVAPGVNFPSVDSSGNDYWVTGSSLATPLTAGIVAVAAQKYPEATGNQLIQSLIHNTTADDHELSRSDDLGYGPVSLRHMLKVDPTTYPDENPLMGKSTYPSASQVARAAEKPAVESTPTRAASPQPSLTAIAGARSDGGVGAPILIGAGALVVVVLVVVVVVVTKSKKKNVGGAV
ncbi:hypothetical protein ET475_03415 [Microbacterium protaetiae]|uniref:Peptidase S8/S53 domain-containing protein n=1 Tax=Microbacterium protaetiae TaxID=2509458 RepID=A0A4P6EAH8_9MICO|nr:S8/S53 family peptidase [Microbacterium protaetiae]QAY59132.1 hypothetical protein ET475_03415 [Microbacterium protaetiae]